MIEIGNRLIERLARAQRNVILAAPFIKANVLRQLLTSLPPGVELQCITRWKVEEILAGVSDLEVWNLIKERPKAHLRLRSDLHAKYYRVDDSCFVGSANLTAAALGWSSRPNLEFLVEISTRTQEVMDFEARLLEGCLGVDQELYEELIQKLETLKECFPQCLILNEEALAGNEQNIGELAIVDTWVPALRNPEDLYLAYAGQLEKLSTMSHEVALQDLKAFLIPIGLPRPLFEADVGLQLLEKPILRHLDAFLATPRRFGEVTAYLQSKLGGSENDLDIKHVWQTLMRWLRYFLPNRYGLSVPIHSEVFYRTVNKRT